MPVRTRPRRVATIELGQSKLRITLVLVGKDAQSSLRDAGTMTRYRGLKPCHYPDLCTKGAFSSSRSDVLNLAVGFNPLSLPKFLREMRALLRRVATA